MDVWQAIVLGIVEGLTEYLPVSSTGHLILAQRAMGLEGEAANAYAICIQAGAIAAVLGLYRVRVRQITQGVFGRDADGRKLMRNLVVAFVPAAVLGGLFDDWIESMLFGLWPIVFAWIVGGLAIFAFSHTSRGARNGRLEDLSWASALAIGGAQCLAMWPGTSRSLVTLLAGLLVGLSLEAAVEFAFLLGLITLTAATGFKALQHGDELLAAYGPTNIALGFGFAWLSAVLAVNWMVSYLRERGLEIFAWWRIGLATVVAGFLSIGWL